MFLTCFVTCFGVSPAPHAAWGLHVGKEGLVVQRLSRYAAPGDSEQSVWNGGHLHPGDSEQSVRNGGCLHHGTASRACGTVGLSTTGTASRACGRVVISTPGQRAERAEGWVSPPRGQRAEPCGRVGVSMEALLRVLVPSVCQAPAPWAALHVTRGGCGPGGC